MNSLLRAVLLAAVVLMLSNLPTKLCAADLNVLIVGSTGTQSDSGGSAPFDPTAVKTHLQKILQGAGLGTVSVVLENRNDPYDLAAWFHYPYPADVETTARWPNLRGEAGIDWDYVIVIGDPYTMELMPGLYAHGVAMVAQEVAKGGAETVLLMPWPKPGSSSTVEHYREVVYRVGRSGPYRVAPAALAWQAAGSPAGATHPSDGGAYIAAASIYSTIWKKSASVSSYDYNDELANTTHAVVSDQNGRAQYTGNFSFQNPFLILDDKRRDVHFSDKGTSTERKFKESAVEAMDRARVIWNHSSYQGKYSSNTPEDDRKGWPVSNPMPIAWNHGRKFAEDYKEYVVNPSYWQLGMGFIYQGDTWGIDVADANDEHLAGVFEEIGLADYMRGGSDLAAGQDASARCIPWRLIWAQIHQYDSSLNPIQDSIGHLNNDLNDAVGTYMYTLYSGRCPLDPAPNPVTRNWVANRIGYETAWRLGRCQARAPGFKVMPSAATKMTIAAGMTETMSVQFILPPLKDVVVNVTLKNPTAATLSKNRLTFTPNNYSAAQSLVIIASTGANAGQDIEVVFNTVSSDEAYNNLSDSWCYSCTPLLPTVGWTTASQSSVNESGTMTVTARLSAASAQPVTLPFTVTGSASSADRSVSASPITIPAGATTGTATIAIKADTFEEANEKVVLTMGAPTNAILGAITKHEATITDDDAPTTTVAWKTSSQASVGENGTLTVTAELSGVSAQNVSVPFTVTGSASSADYTITGSPITIPAGATTGAVTITIQADTLDEANETVILTLGKPTNARLVSGAMTHTATITDDDAPPTVAWTTTNQASVSESGRLTVTAQLSAASGQFVSVGFELGGTASSSDRTVTAGWISIPAGATTGTANIIIEDDSFDETNETVILTLNYSFNATLGTTTVHTATITDDDAPPTVAWTTNNQASAGESGTMTVTAQLSAASSQDVTVPFTVTGTAQSADRAITASPITIAAGATSGTTTIKITADSLDEANETVILTMGTPVNATLGPIKVHTATIMDDDAPPSGPSSKDSIVGQREPNGEDLGYYVNSNNPKVGAGGSTGSRTDRNLVIGYSLPTLPAGTKVTGATFKFEITGGRDSGNLDAGLDVYLLNTSNPDNSGTSFFHHGASANSASAKLVGTKYLSIDTSPVAYVDDQHDVEFALTGEALALLQSFYGGDNVPDRPEAFFRFNLNKDPAVSTFIRYMIDLADNESSLTLQHGSPYGLAEAGASTDITTENAGLSWISATLATPNPAQVGGSVSFSAVANATDFVKYTWHFGDGTEEEGAVVSHMFSTAGEYTVTVMALDANGQSAVASLQVSVSEPPTQFEVSKLSGAVNFKTSGKDVCAIKGILPASDAVFDPQGMTVSVDVGGASRAFTLDAKGRARTQDGSFSLKRKFGKTLTFDAKLINGNWSENWIDDGDVQATSMKQSQQFEVNVKLNGQAFSANVTAICLSQATVGAKFKK